MAGFSSQDEIISALSDWGQGYRADWQKSTFATTAHTAGLWYSLFRGGGNPGADTILGTGTNLAFQALTDTTANATGIPHGGNVGGENPTRCCSTPPRKPQPPPPRPVC